MTATANTRVKTGVTVIGAALDSVVIRSECAVVGNRIAAASPCATIPSANFTR